MADDVFKPYNKKAPAYARPRVTFFFPTRNVVNRQIYSNATVFDYEPSKSEFQQHFEGRIEENVPAATVNIWELDGEIHPREILRELGDRAELPLAHVYALLAKQPRARAGLLRLDALTVCYVRSSHFGTRYVATGEFSADLAHVSIVACAGNERVPSGWSVGVLEGHPDGERWPHDLAYPAVTVLSF